MTVFSTPCPRLARLIPSLAIVDPMGIADTQAGGELVVVGTDLTIQDNKGTSALDYAKEKAQQEAIAALEQTSK
jgi:hypothetical protein